MDRFKETSDEPIMFCSCAQCGEAIVSYDYVKRTHDGEYIHAGYECAIPYAFRMAFDGKGFINENGELE